MMKLGRKFWTALVLFGLIGQVAWVVENMYFNVFIYKMFHASAADISLMVGASAVAATVTTILMGALSGIVEPLGALLTLLAASFILPALPYLLAFAAGAMLYVVVEELIPEMSEGEHSHIGTVLFAVGFSVMMVLDVVLG